MSGYKAVITGASKGIGADLAVRLLDRGYKVIAIDRENATLSHENLQLIEADLLDPAAVAAAPTGAPTLRAIGARRSAMRAAIYRRRRHRLRSRLRRLGREQRLLVRPLH